ncbi:MULTISPECIES: hypothetical protein [unclassified Rhodococcus (in: high G+C Gram-positive bacteria)]
MTKTRAPIALHTLADSASWLADNENGAVVTFSPVENACDGAH